MNKTTFNVSLGFIDSDGKKVVSDLFKKVLCSFLITEKAYLNETEMKFCFFEKREPVTMTHLALIPITEGNREALFVALPKEQEFVTGKLFTILPYEISIPIGSLFSEETLKKIST